MFASASLDGAIVLWSSHSLSYTRQFNFVKNYEGPSHTYPSSTQHVFTVDQVWLIDKRTHLNFDFKAWKIFFFFSAFWVSGEIPLANIHTR